MLNRFALSIAVVFGFALSGFAQEDSDSKPVELEVIEASAGVWDANVEVWPEGQDSPSIKFTGVETNRLFGEYWISSDSDYDGMKLHSIIGYDLDKKKLVGTVIDHGPYAATMSGDYDRKSKTVTWITKAKGLDGKPMLQKTSITQKSADERVLVLTVPGEQENEFTKFMQIRFIKRK